MGDTQANFQNILVIDFGQLGDVVLSLPALSALRRRFPGAHIAVLTGKVPDQVIDLSGLADEVITVDRVRLRDDAKLRSIRWILSFIAEVRRRPIDLVIDLHSLPETNLLAFLSRAKHRLLANRESRSLDMLSNFRPKPPREDKTKHLSDRYVDVLRPLGIEHAAPHFRLTPPAGDAANVADKYFAADRETVGLFPGAGHPSRCWSLENFAALAARFESVGQRTAVILGPEEALMRDSVVKLFPAAAVIIEGLSIPQFVAAAARLSVFVTNDTGPMHLAACAGAPVLLLIDEQAPMTYLPLTDKLATVRNQSIGRISVDDVFQAARELTSKFPAGGK